mgnify:CR=1 FL=1
MISDMRGMSPSSLGGYPIKSVSTSSIVFFSDRDGDGLKDRIRYFLEGDSINKGIITPTQNPVSYSTQETILTVVRDVVNGTSTPIFEYFGSGYIATSTPLEIPIDVSSVRYIKIKVEIDSDLNKPPAKVVSETGVALRNLKDNL